MINDRRSATGLEAVTYCLERCSLEKKEWQQDIDLEIVNIRILLRLLLSIG